MIKILYKINELRKDILIVWAYYILKKYINLDLIEIGNVLNEVGKKMDALNKAAQMFNKAVQRYNKATRGFGRG